MEYLSVIIVDKSIDSRGIVANASFVLGLTAGRELPDSTFGEDVLDGDGENHTYLTKIGHIARKAGQSKLQNLRNDFSQHPDVKVIDYTEDAAPSNYTDYTNSLGKHSGDEISYRAIHVYGPAEVVAPKTKNLSSLS